MATVKIDHVYKDYGSVPAVIDACWHCGDGEVVSLLGPSGCGKSSTLRMIAGLEEITRGSIFIGDREVNSLRPAERNIALAFENYALYPHMTVRQNVAYPLRIRRVDRNEVRERTDRILEMLGLLDIADKIVTGLSGGQKQRVGLGRALIRQPDVFLLDEPISHSDAKLRSKMCEELGHLLRRTEHTAIYVTHDQQEAMTIADRIIVMNLGHVLQIGTPAEIFEEPQDTFVATFIGEPAMNLIKGSFESSEGALRFCVDSQRMIFDSDPHRFGSPPSGDIYLGVRPSKCTLSLDKKEGWLQGTIYTLTMGIDEANYSVEVGGQLLSIVAEQAAGGRIGDPVWVSFEQSSCHYFDPVSQKRLAAAGRSRTGHEQD